jgi:hypothetical protein
MAEYVRRKRPPADHPFWTHLNDRAHPPSVVWPVVVPTGVGLSLGLAAGLNDPLSMRQALGTATAVSGTLAGALALVCGVPLVVQAIRRPRTAETWLNALTTMLGIGLATFLVVWVPLGLFLLWYSFSGGYGPWVGMAIGAALGLGPGVLIAWVNRHRWADRRRRWPRWETMRRRHRRQIAATQAVPQQPTPATDQLEARGDEKVARQEQDQPGA